MTRSKSSSCCASEPHSAGSPGRRCGMRGAGERSRHRFVRGAQLVLRRRGFSAIDAQFEQVRDQGAVVPGLWHLEVANVLLQAETRGRIATADVTMRLDLIAELPIATDNETTPRACARSLRSRGLKD